jgi:two-component system phosphate regulon sensor histidine kinase PhoR
MRFPSPGLSSPIRLFSFFALGVAAPTVFLGFFGLRSFRTEQLLVDKELAERHAAAAGALARRADEVLGAPLAALSADGMEEGGAHAAALRLLALKSLAGSPVEVAFILDRGGTLWCPASPPLPQSASEPAWGALEPEVRRLDRLELAEKNPSAALQGYQALRRRSLTVTQEAELLKMIASSARKSGDQAAARAALEDLAAPRFDVLPDPSGVPMGLLGRRLLVKHHERAGAAAAAERLRQEIYEGLVLGRWPVDPASWDESLREARGAGTGERWPRLEALRGAMDVFRKKAQEWTGAPEVRAARLAGTAGVWRAGASVLLCRPLPGGRGTLFAVVPRSPLWQAVGTVWAAEAAPLGVRVRWEGDPSVPDGWRAAASDAAALVSPPLSFDVLAPLTPAQTTLLRRRRRAYAALVGFSLVAVAAGLAFMLRALRREAAAAALKADFVAGVSHELRTPLASIAYIGERLGAGRYRSEAEAREFLGMLQEETARLQELISGVLDFARMEDGRRVFKKDSLDLGEIARDAAGRFEGKARAHGFVVEKDLPEAPLPAHGDRPALIQAVMNLLDNALKYSGPSRRILLSAGGGPEGAWVKVRDFGIGVPPEEREKVFDRFHRAANAPDRAAGGGVGLGLALVKRIAAGHGARVWVDDAPGGGSVFTLLFPS